jgi:Tol biopolymer transport system component/DNA-binding winged helix-turn-helix (wHTH) protein
VADQYLWDDFLLDLDTYRLERAGVPLALEPKAFDLLALMVRRPGHLFTKREIFATIWPDTAVTDHALTRIVAQLRRVLGDEARESRYLETVPTRGYRWVRPVTTVGDIAVPSSVPVPPAESLAASAAASRRLSPAAAAAAVAVMLVVPLGLWVQHSVSTSTTVATAVAKAIDRAGRSDEVRWPVQVTTYAGLDLHPAFSPQGDAVAFASDRSGSLEIYVRAFGGTAMESAVTADGGQNVQPAWSPDGKFLAYHSSRNGGIWVVAARGGVPRQVVKSGSVPAWAPDGRRLAFQSDEHPDIAPGGFAAQNGSTLWVVDADGQHLQELTRAGSPIGGHASPAWSPDGRYLAFTVFEAGSDNGVWRLSLDSREAVPLARASGLFDSVFAPDGAALYVAGGEPVVVRIPFDPATGKARGPRETIPVPGVPAVQGLTISGDGRRLGFAGLSLDSQIWAQPIHTDGSPAGRSIPLTSDTSRRNSFPAIAPDGTKVAYSSTRRGELSNIWVMGIDGKHATQLTPDDTAEHIPKWLSDSKRVAYLSNRGGKPGIWVTDTSTRREELLIDTTVVQLQSRGTPPLAGWLGEVDVAPSNTRIAFSILAPPDGRRVTYTTGFDRFEPHALSRRDVSVGYPAWSPDERRIAVQIKDGSSTQAGVIDVRTGVLKTLTAATGQTWVRSWSPDGQKVAAATLRGGSWSLQWIDVESGRQEPITPAESPRVYVRYPHWSPRGDAVLFERGEVRGNIWMLPLR